MDGVPHVVGNHQGGEPMLGHDLGRNFQHLGGSLGVQRCGVSRQKQKLRLFQGRHQQGEQLGAARPKAGPPWRSCGPQAPGPGWRARCGIAPLLACNAPAQAPRFAPGASPAQGFPQCPCWPPYRSWGPGTRGPDTPRAYTPAGGPPRPHQW